MRVAISRGYSVIVTGKWKVSEELSTYGREQTRMLVYY